MTDSLNAFAEAQRALFRFWLQPLEMTQAALTAGNELIVKAEEEQHPAPVKPEVALAAEEQFARLDGEIDRAVPMPAGIVA